jgi:hypothetical protein
MAKYQRSLGKNFIIGIAIAILVAVLFITGQIFPALGVSLLVTAFLVPIRDFKIKMLIAALGIVLIVFVAI